MKDLAIISYLTNKIGPLYQTRLYKLLFYIDFCYYKNHNSSMTWYVYYKLPYWPVPLAIKTKIDCMITNLDMEDETIKNDVAEYKKYLEIVQVWNDKFTIKWNFLEETFLTKDEVTIIDYVIDKVWGLGTSKIVSRSHWEDAYKNASMFQPIFYGLSDSLSI